MLQRLIQWFKSLFAKPAATPSPQSTPSVANPFAEFKGWQLDEVVRVLQQRQRWFGITPEFMMMAKEAGVIIREDVEPQPGSSFTDSPDVSDGGLRKYQLANGIPKVIFTNRSGVLHIYSPTGAGRLISVTDAKGTHYPAGTVSRYTVQIGPGEYTFSAVTEGGFVEARLV